jgi:benzodiazapine receptor
MTQRTRNLRSWLAAAAFLLAVFAVTGIGQLVSGRPNEWYARLRKPAFTPPGWIFGPVWTVLYILMGVAAWRVWEQRRRRPVALPLALFAVQLVLNAAWTGLFFGLRSPAAAFADIVALWLALAATAWAFFRASRPAGWLLVPYLAWVTFAAALNLAIWRLNV